MTTAASHHPLHQRYDRILRTVNNPGRYAGCEFTARQQPGPNEPALHLLVAFPDLYEAAFAAAERDVVQALLDAHPRLRVEWACLPARDLERALATHDLPLFSLASRTPLHAFDLVHFVIPEAACFLNVAAMLELGGVPAPAAERGESHPLVTASGPPLLAPEAVAPLLDLVLVGEVEDTLGALAERWPALCEAGLPKSEIALELGRTLDGAYAPAGYRVDPAAPSAPTPTAAGLPPIIHPARVHDLEHAPLPTHPPVPGIRGAEPAIQLEMQRGIDRVTARAGDACVVPAAIRTRSVAHLLEAFETWFSATGLETIVLTGNRPDTHPDLAALIRGLNARLGGLPTRITLPDLPLAAWRPLFPMGKPLTPGRGGRGPVAGLTIRESTPAMARRLGYATEPAALVAEAEALFRAGYDAIAGEAVIGVPGESEHDLTTIGRLARDLSAARRRVDGRFARVEIAIRAWIPRPHTDDERGALLTEEAFAAKLKLLRQAVGRRREVRLRVAGFDRSRVEALLTRGDRDLATALVTAARNGVRLYPESPAEPPEPVADRLLAAAGLGLEQAHAPIPGDTPLPWAHIRIEA